MKIPIDLKSGEVVDKKPADLIVGIDLGTTNSLIAYIENEKPVTIKSPGDKNSLTPSVLFISEDGKIVVGDEAIPFLNSNPENTVYSVKRLIGKLAGDIDEIKSNIGYKIVNDSGESMVQVKVNNQVYSPIELSAEILKTLKQKAEKQLNLSVSKAVITVPAYFNDIQRQATREAGKLAGLDVLRIINEPTAASLAYGIGVDRNMQLNVAVYDLGGGTFDISILHLEDGIFEVLSTHGDTYLGGDDIDKIIIAYWADTLRLTQDQLVNDPVLHQNLRLTAEEAKKALTTFDSFETDFNGNTLSLSRTLFNQLIEPVILKTIDSCKQALADSGLTKSDINKVILVGGSTRIPYLKKTLETFFGQVPDDSLNPDEVVALGAAIQADILAGNRKDILLLDVNPLSLGIETVGGLMDAIIPRNSKVPNRAGRNYTTSVDGQTKLRISVFQGERDLVVNNRKLGEFTLTGIPPMPAGLPKIEVHFILDADGILTVKAEEKRSGTVTSVEIKSAYSISEEKMAEMLLESLKNAEEDLKKRALLEAINEANNVILASQRFIIQNKEYFSDQEMEQIKLLTDKLKESVKSESKEAIEGAMKALNDYSEPIAHKALDINVQKALKGVSMH